MSKDDIGMSGDGDCGGAMGMMVTSDDGGSKLGGRGMDACW